jgi:hypothetical protein
MIWFLRGLFVLILASMLAVTTWAGSLQSLGEFARGPVMRDPWVIATLFDAYWAFVTFFVWVAWKESTLAARLLWFVAIMLLGNIAMASYMLAQLFAVPPTAPLGDVFTQRRPSRLLLPALLALVSAAVYLLA